MAFNVVMFLYYAEVWFEVSGVLLKAYQRSKIHITTRKKTLVHISRHI